MLLGTHVYGHQLGRLIANGGFYLRRNPDTVRGPDVAFLRSERVPSGGLPSGFLDGPPDLAVEVVSHNDSAAEVEAKLRDYLAHGVQRVWLVYPTTRTIVAFRPDGSAQSYREGDVLTDEALLPGLSLAVREVFA
jgi:Uma2 family endonuclease